LAEPRPTTGLDGRPRPKRALVFSGGGARGAYEAGVIHYLLDEFPKRLGRPISFDILCGTSVGAVHACFLAATAKFGYNDARNHENEFAAFFSDEPFEPGP
jgi:predicted acylesterase/phospholipase RssA